MFQGHCTLWSQHCPNKVQQMHYQCSSFDASVFPLGCACATKSVANLWRELNGLQMTCRFEYHDFVSAAKLILLDWFSALQHSGPQSHCTKRGALLVQEALSATDEAIQLVSEIRWPQSDCSHKRSWTQRLEQFRTNQIKQLNSEPVENPVVVKF